jgi:beta-glucanase (GH16 family)
VRRISARVRAAAVCASAAVVLAACATPESATPPDPAPDLFQVLPPPTSAPGAVTPPAATASSAPTTRPKPTPTPTPSKSPRPGSATPGRAPAAAAAAPSDAPKWRQVGGDEFTGDQLDPQWSLYNSAGGFGTGYRRPEAVTQSGGLLSVTARGDISGGTSSSLGQLYGRWEFRARTEPGRGYGSAILLWPDSENWPQDGEVDIMEVPGENRDLANFVLHWAENGQDTVNGTVTPGDYTQWHTFAVEWLPDRLTWFVDGVKQYETTDKTMIPTTPMHLTIQLDQGPKKDWIPAVDETTPPEVSLDVDWVRVYAP